MSRVHDALRRADVPKTPAEPVAPPTASAVPAAVPHEEPVAVAVEPAPADHAEIIDVEPEPRQTSRSYAAEAPPAAAHVADVPAEPAVPPPARKASSARRAASRLPEPPPAPPPAAPSTEPVRRSSTLPGLFGRIDVVPFNPAPDASLLDPFHTTDGPIEEFRGIRTRLNHLQGQRPIKTIVVTSPSPAEGKSFTAANLAITQSQLEGNYVLLADFDFRRPVTHHLFQMERSPGLTEYLQGKIPLEQAIRRFEGTNLFVMPAGELVPNPLELLNLPEAKRLVDYLGSLFRWVIIDTPPLLFAADANLLSTMCDGTVMVVRVGATTVDSVTRALQSLCQNNVLGIIVNGAHRGELYSKFTYYHSYYYAKPD